MKPCSDLGSCVPEVHVFLYFRFVLWFVDPVPQVKIIKVMSQDKMVLGTCAPLVAYRAFDLSQFKWPTSFSEIAPWVCGTGQPV